MTRFRPGSGGAATRSWRFATLGEALTQHAKDRAEQVAVRFVAPGGGSLADSEVSTLTYAELDRRAASVAAILAEQGAAGERALLLCPPGLDYVAALFGCFYAGAVAVPAYPPVTSGFDERLARLVADSAPSAVLTVEAIADFCEVVYRRAIGDGADAHMVLVDASAPGERFTPTPERRADDLALLQYTSGSTGNPHGVMLTHSNFLANVSSIVSHLDIANDARGVYWLPPYHDMGLVGGIIAPLVRGSEANLMSPMSFLASPLLWLEAVSRYRGIFSAAPNFAYDLCVRKITEEQAAALDLSSWKSVVNGAEPVRTETMERFAAHFADAGFRRSAFVPAYGLAEATLLVSAARFGARRGSAAARTRGGNGGARARPSSPTGALVSVGVPDEDASLQIVDPESGRALPAGEVGEIWFSGPSVGGGYWSNPAKSEETFGATLAEGPDGPCFLRTGDLGVLYDGELYVGGRIKDLIIVRGQNYYPQDVELAASKADSALRAGCLAAFGIDGQEGERLVVVAELARALQDECAGEALFERVRARIGEDVGLALHELVLVERGSSLKTSSGKIRRSATRAAYFEEALKVVAAYRCSPAADDAPSESMAAAEGAESRPSNGAHPKRGPEEPLAGRRAHGLVVRNLTALLPGISPATIASGRTFKELGLESPDAVELSARLAKATGLDLPATLCFEQTSPAALASYLSSLLVGEGSRSLAQPRARSGGEPVAIVGMACRFPGGVDSAGTLWELLERGEDAISGFPRDRGWDLARLLDDDAEQPGTSRAREGGFLEDAADFDAGFFGIGPGHADAIDPQQRLMLEVAWEALEDAGLDPSALEGSATAVFAGVSSSDHALRLGAGRARDLEAHLLTGAAASAVSGRVAYALGLSGAAVTVDTACSSSLVALHEAFRALAAGECSLALAGGVTVLSTAAVFTGFSRQGGLAADGRCKSFAARADGTGFSEGAGVLVLERLRDAEERGHRVLALVRGSAVNQDGRSNGFTAPSPNAQEEVIRAALAAADLTADDVDAVEAHGTGTVLGDPIEAQSLIATYGAGRVRPLWLGSVKSNLGHTQAAAGVAGVMKMVMAMRRGVLPRSLHADEPSPHVDWEAGALRLLSDAHEWRRGARPRRAGVSSFGISGTNAHVVLEEAPPRSEADRPAEVFLLPFLLTAKSDSALRSQARRLRAHIERDRDLAPIDVAYTLATGRARMEHRAVILASDRDSLVCGLDALIDEEYRANVIRGRAASDASVAFVFGGQGAQWQGMARELMDSSATFAHSVRVCATALSACCEWSLEDVLRGAAEAPALDRVDVVQPALWAVMVSLAELWRSFGVQPSLVLGHSQGEIAAAQIAGALSLQDAARLVALRGAMLTALEGAGDMVSLGVSAPEAERLIARFGGRISIAAENGPKATVVSGENEALDELIATCKEEALRARRIAVGFASHSPQVEAIRERFLASLETLRARSSQVPFLSCLYAEVIDTAGLEPEYWYRSLREPVRFRQATRALLREGCSALVEVSPHPVLAVPMEETIEETATGQEVVVIASQRRDSAGERTFLSALAEAFVQGVEPDWRPLFSGRGARLVGLPTYPFERERHWLMPATPERDAIVALRGRPEHPLLETSVRLADRDAWLLSGQISLQTHPWLADHRLLDTVVLPASACLQMALHAGGKVGYDEVKELVMEAPLAVPEEGVVELQVSLGEPEEDDRRALLIASRASARRGEEEEEGEWSHNARGVLMPASELPREPPARAAWPPAGAEPIDLEHLRERLAELGVSTQEPAARISAAWSLGEEVLVELAGAQGDAGFAMDPAAVDSMLYAASAQIGSSDDVGVQVPFAWRGVRGREADTSARRARIRVREDSLAIDVSDEAGRQALSVKEVVMRPLHAAQLRSCSSADRELLLGLDWVQQSASAEGGEWHGMVALGEGAFGPSSLPRYADVASVADAAGADTSLRTVLVPVSAAEDAAGVRHGAERALSLLQAWLADERLRELRLVLVTTRAVAARVGEAPNLAGAAVWGLVRSAQSEHPRRMTLIDLDGTKTSWAVLPAALASGAPQIALRDGTLLVPRLSPRERPQVDGELEFPSGSTVLVTGATGALGSLIARHLAREHGARHLLLVSRRGPDAPGAAELEQELIKFGCEARLVACDVSDRASLSRLIESVPRAHPLSGIVHAAGTLDDGLLESLDRERLDRVMVSKVDGAIALDELSATLPLAAFVLISSAIGTIGGAGQANYAAANAVLDAIAQARRARGRVAHSLAFGLWQRDLGRDGSERADALAHLESQVRARMGMLALEPERGLALFDAALAAPDALLVPIWLDMEVLRGNAQVDAIPPVFDGLIARPKRRESSTSLRTHLLNAPGAERQAFATELVEEEAAAVLGRERVQITGERTLVELGGESLDALELRNRLEARSGVRLRTQLFFGEPLDTVASSLLATIEADDAHRRVRPEGRGTLRSLLQAARETDRVPEFVSTLIELSALRPSCEHIGELPRRLVLNGAGHPPSLIGIPSFMVGSGPHQFARLARSLDGRRMLSVLALPGAHADERAPASWELAIEALCDATLASANQQPYVLVGYSSGGVLAHAVAERCEAHGEGPDGVVMIDTYSAGNGDVFASLLGETIDRAGVYLEVGDAELMAMGTFLRLAAEWRPGVVRAPALYLHAARSLTVLPDPEPLSAPFLLPETLISLDADHFTIIEEEVAASASAIESWLDRLAMTENGERSAPMAPTAPANRQPM